MSLFVFWYGFMMAANNTDQGRGKPPVFIPCRNLPDNTENGFQYTVRELCAAAEKTSGYNSVIGAQKIGGLWRIYPKSADSRAMLLLKGIEIQYLTVNPFDKNPYIVKTPDSSPTQQPDSAKAARTGDLPAQPRDPNNQEAPAQEGRGPAVT